VWPEDYHTIGANM